MNKTHKQPLHATEIRTLKWTGTVNRLDKIRKEHIRGTFNMTPLQKKLKETFWYGHVMRRDDSHMTK